LTRGRSREGRRSMVNIHGRKGSRNGAMKELRHKTLGLEILKTPVTIEFNLAEPSTTVSRCRA
jgi:hypothetical protein